MQAAQEKLPGPEDDPASQFVQNAEEYAPRVTEYFPALQSVQAALASELAYLPASQLRQAAAFSPPSSELAVPTAQLKHSPPSPSSLYFPVLHWMQSSGLVELIAAVVRPTPQSTQSVTASSRLKRPTWQI